MDKLKDLYSGETSKCEVEAAGMIERIHAMEPIWELKRFIDDGLTIPGN